MPTTSSYYETRDADGAEYAQFSQNYLDATVQRIPLADKDHEIDQLGQQMRELSSSVTPEGLQESFDMFIAAIIDKVQEVLWARRDRVRQNPQNVVQVNTTFQGSNRNCFSCFGRDKNGTIDPDYNHTNSNDCPLMHELINTGCIHKSGYSWCKGKWDPNRPSIPFILRKNQRWYDQIKAQLQGRPYMGRRTANGPRF